MASFEFLAIIFTGIGLIVSILYYTFTLQNSNKTRRTQLFTQIYKERYNQENIQRWWELMSWEWEDWDEYYNKYGGFGVDTKQAAISVAHFSYYDGLGLLVKNKMVDVLTVFQLMHSPIIALWLKFESIIKSMRNIPGGPSLNYMESWEFLANEMIKMRIERGISLPVWVLHPSSSLLGKYSEVEDITTQKAIWKRDSDR